MAHKKKAPREIEGKQAARIIKRHRREVLIAARNLYGRTLQPVTPVDIYHHLKEDLGLPFGLDLDAADAIKEILKEEGWIT